MCGDEALGCGAAECIGMRGDKMCERPGGHSCMRETITGRHVMSEVCL